MDVFEGNVLGFFEYPNKCLVAICNSLYQQYCNEQKLLKYFSQTTNLFLFKCYLGLLIIRNFFVCSNQEKMCPFKCLNSIEFINFKFYSGFGMFKT